MSPPLTCFQDVLKDGILAMILDLALQFAGTTSVYVAAFVSLQDMYQLSAAGAALPQFSAYATAVGYLALRRNHGVSFCSKLPKIWGRKRPCLVLLKIF
jgi:hypothetical protein